jgi:four helix bundle protein
MESGKSKTFKELEVWKKAHAFVLMAYGKTESFPKHELYGLTSQFRRAAVSIAANIAEGYRKKGKADKLRFFNIAQGSLEECRYFIILSKDLHYFDENTENELNICIEDVSKTLNGYCHKIIDDIHSTC